MDNYLKASAKPTVSPQTEVVFRSFIDNGVAANAQWLEFLKGEVSDTTRAEVAVTKTMKVSVDSQSVDRAQLARQLQNNKITEREKYGVIIGFTNYALSATYFKNAAAGATVSGYGAKIGGNWYSKSEHSRIHHRIVAVWSPLPFVLDSPASGAPVDLQQSTLEAIRMNRISVQPLPVPAGDTAHILRKGLF